MGPDRRIELAVVVVLMVAIAANLVVRWSSAATPKHAASPAASASPVASPFAGLVQVTIDRMLYLPRRVEIPVGTTVAWVNREGVPHTVTAPGEFNSGRMDRDGRYERLFAEAGVYWYECLYHNNMSGLVVVQPAAE
jgi:plastocyanin